VLDSIAALCISLKSDIYIFFNKLDIISA
jgi:hypothetical protein